MKNILLFPLLAIGILLHSQTASFHDYSAVTIAGDTISMSQYYGKKVMVVNTASECGYVDQYEDLQTLFSGYQQYGFEIVGFPCNDFFSQEPGDDSTINQFCTDNYHISFQMMSKVQIVTGDTAPVYKWLQRADLNGVTNKQVVWNFNKFLIDEAGHWVNFYNQNTNPLAAAITNWILTPSVISGVEENTLSNLASLVSANPVNHQISVMLNQTSQSQTDIRLFSNEGKLVEEIFNGVSSENQIINHSVSKLSNGIYFLRINQGNAQETIRVSILH